MYALVHRINVLQANVNGLQSTLANIYQKQASPQASEKETSVQAEQFLDIQNKVEELSKSIHRIQIDLTTKQTEIKKESVARDEDIRRDIKLLETTLPIKLEQLVNKIVKDRIEQLGQELKNSLQTVDLTPMSSIHPNEEDFEINVTLTGENDTSKITAKATTDKKPKAPRAKKAVKSSGDV